MTPSWPKIRRSAAVVRRPIPAARSAFASDSSTNVRLPAIWSRNAAGDNPTQKLWAGIGASGP